MRVSSSRWQIKDRDFGPLLSYIKDDNVTDIDWNGEQLWIENLIKGRYCAPELLPADFVDYFSQKIADAVSEQFNQAQPVLEAETETLRISIVHESCANTGRSISIRKTPIIRRLSRERMFSTNYISKEGLAFLENCVLAKCSMLACGLPATGKTEFIKYLTSFIRPQDRAITIEDNLELHYPQINPKCDCVELKVDDRFTYTDAIKASLRQNPQWILLSEARSTEVKYLIESMSTGTHCLTTIHTDDVRKVPDRIKNMCSDSVMADRIENDVFSFLDVALLIKKRIEDGKVVRRIDQIAIFSRETDESGHSENVCKIIMDEGKIIDTDFPAHFKMMMSEAGIENPFVPHDEVLAEKQKLEEEKRKADTIDFAEKVQSSPKYKNLFVVTEDYHEKDNISRQKRYQQMGVVYS